VEEKGKGEGERDSMLSGFEDGWVVGLLKARRRKAVVYQSEEKR